MPAAAAPRCSAKESGNLDLLRALAVALVLADHSLEMTATLGAKSLNPVSFHPWDWYFGRLGVLLFFVHTSLVLMRSLERLAPTCSRLALSFYIRRAFRIYPLSVCCVLAVVLFGVPALPWLGYSAPNAVILVSNLALAQNVLLVKSVLSPLWSLPLEVQMYLVLPGVYSLTRLSRPIAAMGTIYVGSVAIALVQPQLSPRLNVAQFVPCFLAGCISFVLSKRVAPRLPGWVWPLSLLLAVGAYVAWEDREPSMHPRALAWFACLAVGIAIPLHREIDQPLVNRLSHKVAKYSYGIYLSHVVLLWVVFERLSLRPAAGWALFGVLLVLVSTAAYHLVEEPMIRAGTRLSARLQGPQANRN